jgi:alpha-ketoglutarate-dependent taurine dioxygenase
MSDPNSEKPSLANLANRRRKPVNVEQASMVEERLLLPNQSFPFLIQPSTGMAAVDLRSWISGNRDSTLLHLRQHGAVLFRGFSVGGVEVFEDILRELSGELIDYSYRSTPRSVVANKIYTSTEYPPDRSIPMHNEMSYSRQWPRKIGFFCMLPAEQGGATPLADSREVLRRLSPEVRERFRSQGILYVRNYGKHLDLPWQDVFQTDDRAEVQRICTRLGLDYEWSADGSLKTRQVCQALAIHPDTHEELWFNQAHLFHVSSLGEELASLLLASASEEELPRNTYYGDGAPIAPETLTEIRAAFAASTVTFTWQKEDLLLVDNMLIAHGREPYQGARKIVVGMAEPYSSDSF